MRTLILSDLHGNLAALNAILDHANEHFRPHEVWCLGDTVGYGPEPDNVWRTLRNEPMPDGGWLAGNHDWGLLSKLSFGGIFDVNGDGQGIGIQNYREEAVAVLQHQQETLQHQVRLWQHLCDLPVMSQVRSGIYLTHGAFLPKLERAITHYMVKVGMTALPYSPQKMVENFETAAAADNTYIFTNDETTVPRLFAFGHNHMPGLWRWQHDAWHMLPLDTPHPLGELEQSPICVNPGSVGFPRNGLGCPSYAIIDWQGDKLAGEPAIAIQFVPYDVKITRAKMSEPPYSALLKEAQFLAKPRC